MASVGRSNHELAEVSVLKKLVLTAAIAVASLSPIAYAQAARPEYELQRIPMGPRPDRYVYQRVYGKEFGERPHALTRRVEEPVKWRVEQRWAGPHYIGPVWVRVREGKRTAG